MTDIKGVICGNCSTCIFRHYAVTEGRCWNCKALLDGGATCTPSI